MLLSQPEQTAYDLRFRLFGVPVTIHPMFWLFSVIFGWDIAQADNGLLYLSIFVACMLVSLLVHEMGHVAAFRVFGIRSHVVLYAMGGLAVPDGEARARWKRIVVSAAGPGAGFCLLGVVAGFFYLALPHLPINLALSPWLLFALGNLVFMNLIWNLLNLVPIFPLDGGQIARELWTGAMPRNGLRMAYGSSFLLAGLIACFCVITKAQPELRPWWFTIDAVFGGILFAALAFENFQRMQQAERLSRHWDWHDQ